MFASIRSSIRVPRGRSQVVVDSAWISGSLLSVSMTSSKYCASVAVGVREVTLAGVPLVSCE